MIEEIYKKQTELLLDILPYVLSEAHFALKGGTAINLFLRNMPRISVDIDLTYTPFTDRKSSLSSIGNSLSAISSMIEKKLANTRVNEISYVEGNLTKLIVERSGSLVKIEPNLILRGAIFPTVECNISKEVEHVFGTFLNSRILSTADLYGSKICAALDRQHPRDFFDIHILMQNEGLTDEIRKAFVIYLAGHNRPMNELLNPNLKDIKEVFENEFAGMARVDVSYEELEQTRDMLISRIRKELTADEREFLLSIKKGEPEWDLMNIAKIDKFPAIQWKLINIKRMPPKKHRESLEMLRKVLEI